MICCLFYCVLLLKTLYTGSCHLFSPLSFLTCECISAVISCILISDEARGWLVCGARVGFSLPPLHWPSRAGPGRVRCLPSSLSLLLVRALATVETDESSGIKPRSPARTSDPNCGPFQYRESYGLGAVSCEPRLLAQLRTGGC